MISSGVRRRPFRSGRKSGSVHTANESPSFRSQVIRRHIRVAIISANKRVGPRTGCRRAHGEYTCTNRIAVKPSIIEERVLERLQTELLPKGQRLANGIPYHRSLLAWP